MPVSTVFDRASASLSNALDAARARKIKSRYLPIPLSRLSSGSSGRATPLEMVVSEGDQAPASMTEGGSTSDTGPENDTPPQSPTGLANLKALNSPKWTFVEPEFFDKRPPLSTLPSYLSSLSAAGAAEEGGYETEMEGGRTIRASTLQKAPNGSPRLKAVDAARPVTVSRLRSNSLRVVVEDRKRRSTLDQLREQWENQNRSEDGRICPKDSGSDDEEDDRFMTIKASAFSSRLRGGSITNGSSPRENRPPKLDLSNISVLSPGPPSARGRAGSIRGRAPGGSGVAVSSPLTTTSIPAGLPPPLIPAPTEDGLPSSTSMDITEAPEASGSTVIKPGCPFSPVESNTVYSLPILNPAPVMEKMSADDLAILTSPSPLINIPLPRLRPVMLDVLPSPLDLAEHRPDSPRATISAYPSIKANEPHGNGHTRRTSVTVSDILFRKLTPTKHSRSFGSEGSSLEELNRAFDYDDEVMSPRRPRWSTYSSSGSRVPLLERSASDP